MKQTPAADELGIDLASRREEELFKWFLACLLFGKPIQREIAERAYLELIHARLVSPDAILRAGWDKLVRLLDQAHYVRYDFSTATKLLEVSKELKKRYGSLTDLTAQARTPGELSARVQEFKHVGPVTARIFLQGVRPIWYGSPMRGKRIGKKEPRRDDLPRSVGRSSQKASSQSDTRTVSAEVDSCCIQRVPAAAR